MAIFLVHKNAGKKVKCVEESKCDEESKKSVRESYFPPRCLFSFKLFFSG